MRGTFGFVSSGGGPGPAGATGPQGPVGAQGPTGPQGVNLTLLYGPMASVPSPLNLGVFYFATDTGVLLFGNPGYGPGYLTIGDMRGMNDLLTKILLELKAIRLAASVSAEATGKAKMEDFDFDLSLADDPSINTQLT